ncbi:hypothetical protein GQ43DRAFT_368044, partial [Delitschia confertaspora ATCC 74209]
TSRISARPIPKTQLADPRQYQLSQLRRRFALKERNENNVTVLEFHLKPSDPDFPFDMDSLNCVLRVPLDYPKGEAPSLKVTNPDMPRGYQINVEKGFDGIVAGKPSATLLTHLNALDRQLEELLTRQKADTIKIMAPAPNPEKSQPSAPLSQEKDKPDSTPKSAYVPPEVRSVPSAAQKAAARQVRDTEVRQLEARMSRVAQFSKSRDGISFTVPIEPRKRTDLPIGLRAVKLVRLIVPDGYDIDPCRVEIIADDKEAAKNVEAAFLEHSRSTKMSLFSRINYLSQHIHTWAKRKLQSDAKSTDIPLAPGSVQGADMPKASLDRDTEPEQLHVRGEGDRPHVITIPRPPEWSTGHDDEEEEEEEEESSDSSEDEDEHQEETKAGEEDTQERQTPAAPTAAPPTAGGVLISFPHLELHGIELLEMESLSVSVKCDRCKTVKDVTKLQSTTKGGQARQDSCTKCARTFSIAFTADLLHTNSIRAAHLDLNGCTIVDMLLSSFIPTCAECSTPHPQPGVPAVRGDTSMAFCRECHKKMTFRIPEVKFLRISNASAALPDLPLRKKKPEKLGIVSGQELPDRGRCAHYKKSYRWFRFSCCGKVFPCDRCHDQTADHPIEQANRMICGFCSREQNYRPKDCGICHAWLTVRPGKGFWEGGTGTRDQLRMSRKDPRKYKRLPGSKVGKSKS